MRADRPSTTATMVAFWRSLADTGTTTVPGFADPQARSLLPDGAWQWAFQRVLRRTSLPADPLRESLTPWVDMMAMRVAFIDQAVRAEPTPQVVILGAGLDTRAWRLDCLEGTRVFEVDHPATQAYKRRKAPTLGPPRCAHTWVAVDLERDDLVAALQAAGHRANVPTTWIWEGVVMYLDDDALRRSLAAIFQSSASGSSLLLHYHEPEGSRRPAALRRLVFGWLREPQIGLRSRQQVQREVTDAGFTVIEDAGAIEQAARLGARLPDNPRVLVSRILRARPDAIGA